jgi:hypothetical protein
MHAPTRQYPITLVSPNFTQKVDIMTPTSYRVNFVTNKCHYYEHTRVTKKILRQF